MFAFILRGPINFQTRPERHTVITEDANANRLSGVQNDPPCLFTLIKIKVAEIILV